MIVRIQWVQTAAALIHAAEKENVANVWLITADQEKFRGVFSALKEKKPMTALLKHSFVTGTDNPNFTPGADYGNQTNI